MAETENATADTADALRRALEDRPDDPRLLWRLAGVEIKAGRPDLASEILRTLAKAHPTPDVLERLGSVLNRLGRHHEALPVLRRALELQPQRASVWNSAGEALGNLGQITEAVDAFANAVRWRPEFAHAHYNLGLALRAAGQQEAALRALRHAVELSPDAAEPLQALGHLLHARGRYDQAVRCFRKLVRLRPADAAAHTSLGASLHMLGHLDAARDAYQQALALKPDYPTAHSNLGTVYQSLRDPDRAEQCFRRALGIAPGDENALAGLAATLDRRGGYQEGWDLLEQSLDPARSSVELAITAAQLRRHLGDNARAAEILRAVLERQDLSDASLQRLHFNLGDVCDAEGRDAEAFEHYRRGNRSKPVRFNVQEYADDVSRLLEVYAPPALGSLNRVADPDPRPVLVIGMPRSGTSLVEQILACHPRIAGAGELTDLGRLAFGLGDAEGIRFPDSAASASRDSLAAAAREYSARLSAVDADAARVIDKTPANHLFVGFLEQLYPAARVIHCVRHPLDTALSCYFQNFAGQGIPFSYRLEDIAVYYNGYLQVMDHWRRHSGLAFHEVVYEELVSDQENVSRELLAFLDLDWDPACLDFHKLDRPVATASHAQVRRPMYRSSAGRYRRYEQWLGPLIEGIDWQAWRATGFADRVDAQIDDS